MKERLRGLVLALGVGLGVLGVAEAALWIAAPVSDPYAVLKVPVNQFIRSNVPARLSLRTDVEPGLPGMRGPNRFTTNNLGFRGDSLIVPKPPREIRVFLLGGSSTECLYLDDTAALNAVVQRALQRLVGAGSAVRVYGVGTSGHRSDDHVSMFVHRVVHLEPDLIVVFSGINDLTAAISGHDPLHYAGQGSAPDTLGFLQLVRVTATEFQLPRRVFYLAKRLRPPADRELLERIPLRSDYRTLVDLQRRAPTTTEAPPIPSAAYGANLRSLVGAARANRVGVVLMTQQTTWASTVDPRVEEWQWMLYRNGRTYDARHMDRALEALNDVMRQVARESGLRLYDLARSIPKSLEYFYDDVHFNQRGAHRAGEELAAVISAALSAARMGD